MAQGGNTLSRNPNVCASCSSMMDGMGDSDPMEQLSATEEVPHEPLKDWTPEEKEIVSGSVATSGSGRKQR